jgi:hypothetical protein
MPFALLALAGLVQAPSGEEILHKVFERYVKMKGFEAVISKMARDRSEDPLTPAITTVFSYESPQRWRIDYADYWGGGAVYVRNGKQLKIVSADSGDPQVVEAGPSLMRSNPNLGPGGAAFSVIYLLMEGPAAYDRLVAPKAPVKVQGNWLSFQTKDLGNMTLHLMDGLVDRVEFDNRASRMAAYMWFPMFSEKPETPLEVESISYKLPAKFTKGLFTIKSS